MKPLWVRKRHDGIATLHRNPVEECMAWNGEVLTHQEAERLLAGGYIRLCPTCLKK